MYFDDEYVQLIKEKYPKGTRIVVDTMNDDPRPIAAGTAGTVRLVDDMGTIHCDFDNGRRLGLIPGEDIFHIEIPKEKAIKAILCEPGKKARITTITNNLESLQKMVGGYIEAIYPFDDSVAIVCNEEGKLNGMELNRALRDEHGNIYDILAGPFLIVGLGEKDFTSLSECSQDKYGKLFERPEVFIQAGHAIHAVPVDIPEKPKATRRR